jgi:predicted RNase H-like HicB family nuclease
MKYLVVIEETGAGFGAYVPDLPGCIAAADSREEVTRLIHEAIEFHLEALAADGSPIPEAHSTFEVVEVPGR